MPRALRLSALVTACAALLAACGGSDGSDPAPTPAPPAATGLAGTVAVGVPLVDARVRILDADGAVVAEDIVVQDDGSYTVPELNGRAPFRVEACGFAGGQYRCLVSAAQGPGTANVTPLTDAAVLLAGGLSAEALASAQATLRDVLAPVTEGHVPADFDFIGGALQAGSRTGYDRVLDALGVATGVDGTPFVQITPRTGSGNLFLQGGASSGSLSVDSAAAALSLEGLDALFARMSQAMSGAGGCATGLAAEMASGAHLDAGGEPVSGASQVAAMLCGMLAEQGLFGATLMNPTLGRCDTSGLMARCRVGFVMRLPDGGIMPIAQDMGVVREGGAWKFLGNFDNVAISATANAQRSRRVDGDTPQDSYERALAVEVPALSGLGCAKATQRTAGGGQATVAYYKPFGQGARRLSLWRGIDGDRSLDPASGQLRSGDDTWLMLPEGAEGDAVARNFFRGGRTITVSLYADAGCTSAFSVGGQSQFEVDVAGAVPVWASMPSLPWPELAADTLSSLRTLSAAAGATATLAVDWTYPAGHGGFGQLMFCDDLAACGDGEPGRLASVEFSPARLSYALGVTVPGDGLGATRMLSFYGRAADGTGMQANFMSCPAVSAGQRCQ